MNKDDLYTFLQSEKLAVLATIASDGSPQAALVGFAVTGNLELIFDTVKSSRKYPNLLNKSHVALVIGCGAEVTVQYEGIAEELGGEGLAHYKKIYFAKFPDGPEREGWPGIVYFVVRPKWVRYSDYNPGRSGIEEFRF